MSDKNTNITGLSNSGKNLLPTKRGADTGTPQTPPPTRIAPPVETAKSKPTSYGQSGYSQASSTTPGQRVISGLAASIEADNDDKILAAIIGHDSRRDGHYAVDSTDQWQTRPANKSPIRPAENMKGDPNASGSPSGKVASGLASDQLQTARKPV